MTARALVYAQPGDPATVLGLEERPVAAPGAGQVAIRMRFAPINPADLNTIEGRYPVRPELPAVPGVEGVGEVEAAGDGVRRPAVGQMVLVPHGVGSWQERCVAAADDVYVVPAGVPPEQAAMLKINPATAWRLLHDYVPLRPGEWVLQNAANSGVGRAVIQIARALDLRTANIVRRPELIGELRAAGGDLVVLPEELELKKIAGLGVRLALNAVGGPLVAAMAKLLAPGGVVVTYGGMSKQPLTIPTGLLIFKDLQFRGCWVSRWYREAPAAEREAMVRALADMARRGVINTPVERVFELGEFREAIGRATAERRAGKILFAMNRAGA